jgi:hypothetical protein
MMVTAQVTRRSKITMGENEDRDKKNGNGNEALWHS